MLPLAGVFLATSAGILIYINYLYHSYFLGAYHKYPELVAKELRKAVYYSNIDLQPQNAIKYYKKSLEVAAQVGMDPFSNEVMGIKIKVAELMEKLQQYQRAIEVLEVVKRDNLQWIDTIGKLPERIEQRSQVLAKSVAIAVKLGDLYSSPYVMEQEHAEEQLVWAVTTVLKEEERRQKEGVKPGEADAWMSAEEVGASFENLAHHYEEGNKHYLAAPLFLQALTMSPPKSCHTAVLMNNLSISLAQQIPTSVPGVPAPSRPQLIQNAREWAEKAIELTSKIAPPERTEECDAGCAVATHNLGEFAEMDGNIREASKRYEEAKSLSKAIGFMDGVQNSNQALLRLGKPK